MERRQGYRALNSFGKNATNIRRETRRVSSQLHLSSSHAAYPQPNALQATMNVDGLPSSPLMRHTSLPPSSAPDPSQPSNGHPTPRRSRPVADALAFDDEAGEDTKNEQEAGARRRARPRTQRNAADIPLVRDAVGESVREAFETFLNT